MSPYRTPAEVPRKRWGATRMARAYSRVYSVLFRRRCEPCHALKRRGRDNRWFGGYSDRWYCEKHDPYHAILPGSSPFRGALAPPPNGLTWQQVGMISTLTASVIVAHVYAPSTIAAVVSIGATIVGALFINPPVAVREKSTEETRTSLE